MSVMGVRKHYQVQVSVENGMLKEKHGMAYLTVVDKKSIVQDKKVGGAQACVNW